MKYRIVHTTAYQYSAPVSLCRNQVMLTPRESAAVSCQSHRLTIRPHPGQTSRRTDAFGNSVHVFSLEENHSQLSITATSRLTISERTLPAPAETQTVREIRTLLKDGYTDAENSWINTVPFLFDSPRIRWAQQYSEYMTPFLTDGATILQLVQGLTERIYGEFRYDKTATDVDTPTEHAFDERSGVCQDFAHVAIACFRSIGLATRYVSGYLRTIPPEGKPRLVGADQSHAWVSVWCGPQLGWVDTDPTNNCLCSSDHIPIAWGRDYTDVVPIKGVFIGGGEPSLTVSVDVESL